VHELRLLAITTVTFTAQTVLTYGAFDSYRYPMPTMVCGALCGFAALDDALRGAARFLVRRTGAAAHGDLAASLLAWLSVLLVLWQFEAFGGRYKLPLAAVAWRAYLSDVPSDAGSAAWRSSVPTAAPTRRGVPALCSALRRGALVAASDPWLVHGWCGNPTISLPIDLNNRPLLQVEFLTREAPAYLVGGGSDLLAWLGRSRRLRRVAASGPFEVYALRQQAGRPAVWKPPPPPLCAGRLASCPRRVWD